jgi:leucyl-tRNA synthetase
LALLCPFAPHICEELWFLAGGGGFLSLSPWVGYDEEKTKENTVEMAVQINGKVRDKIIVEAGISKEQALNLAKSSGRIKELIAGKEIIKEIVVPDKIVNIAIK